MIFCTSHRKSYDLYAQELAAQPKLESSLHDFDSPIATPSTRDAVKHTLEQMKLRAPRIPLPAPTAEETQQALNMPELLTYESRLRRLYLNGSTVNYLPFSGRSKRARTTRASSASLVDPSLILDYEFKVKLFWIVSRLNNCHYCLGHQESKLLAEGMDDDQIAALDCDWSRYPENERVAFELAKRMTYTPYELTQADIDGCLKHFSPMETIELICSIAGNNAINRWKEGIGVPQSHHGGGFLSNITPKESQQTGDIAEHSYLTATSVEFRDRQSQLLAEQLDGFKKRNSSSTHFATVSERPPLEQGKELHQKLLDVQSRRSRLPLVPKKQAKQALNLPDDGEDLPAWQRLIAHFPIAGQRLITGVTQAEQSSDLDANLRSKIDWVVARQNGAWYNVAQAQASLVKSEADTRLLEALDAEDFSLHGALTDREIKLLILARNLAASPVVLTGKQVAEAIEVSSPPTVTQLINYVSYRSVLDRITEAAGLGLQN